MSNGATLSIMGLYNNDNTVLDSMVFPDGFTDEQKEIVKQNILIEAAENQDKTKKKIFFKL